MTLSDACNVLHINEGDNDELVSSLLAALPDYIAVTTGLLPVNQSTEPLVETLSGFLLTLWYYADHSDDQALTRTIDALTKALTLKARDYEPGRESE